MSNHRAVFRDNVLDDYCTLSQGIPFKDWKFVRATIRDQSFAAWLGQVEETVLCLLSHMTDTNHAYCFLRSIGYLVLYITICWLVTLQYERLTLSLTVHYR